MDVVVRLADLVAVRHDPPVVGQISSATRLYVSMGPAPGGPRSRCGRGRPPCPTCGGWPPRPACGRASDSRRSRRCGAARPPSRAAAPGRRPGSAPRTGCSGGRRAGARASLRSTSRNSLTPKCGVEPHLAGRLVGRDLVEVARQPVLRARPCPPRSRRGLSSARTSASRSNASTTLSPDSWSDQASRSCRPGTRRCPGRPRPPRVPRPASGANWVRITST